MTRKKLFLPLIFIVLALGMILQGCGSSSDSGGGVIVVPPPTPPKLDIDPSNPISFIGKYEIRKAKVSKNEAVLIDTASSNGNDTVQGLFTVGQIKGKLTANTVTIAYFSGFKFTFAAGSTVPAADQNVFKEFNTMNVELTTPSINNIAADVPSVFANAFLTIDATLIKGTNKITLKAKPVSNTTTPNFGNTGKPCTLVYTSTVNDYNIELEIEKVAVGYAMTDPLPVISPTEVGTPPAQ